MICRDTEAANRTTDALGILSHNKRLMDAVMKVLQHIANYITRPELLREAEAEANHHVKCRLPSIVKYGMEGDPGEPLPASPPPPCLTTRHARLTDDECVESRMSINATLIQLPSLLSYEYPGYSLVLRILHHDLLIYLFQFGVLWCALLSTVSM